MNREEAKRRATELVEQMTIEEAASQLKFNSPAIDRLNIEEYNWWSEGLHGVARAGTATVFPQAIGLAAMFDEKMLEDVASVISIEARAKYNESRKRGDRDIYKGLTLWSPNVNIFRDPRWGRGHETYGEDPYLTSRLGVSFVKGLQGDDEFLRIAACAKHFAVHSGPEELRHGFDVHPSKKDMFETYLPAFEACVKEAKVESVMGAYNRVNGKPACGSDELQEILRKDWRFDGHFVSDCWAIKDFHDNHRVTSSFFESAKLALENGCDLNCGCTYEYIMMAYEKGMISEEIIRQSAVRLFTTRMMLGMFDKTKFDEIGYDVVECSEHIDLSREAAAKSLVLLKNDGILPIDKSKVKTVGVIGPNAASRLALMGNYHGTASRYVTVLDGLKDALEPDVRVMYSKGCNISSDREEFLAKADDRISEALTVCDYSDVVILCLGLNENLEGEEGDAGNAYFSGDKAVLELPESQIKLLKAVAGSGTPFVLCMLAGSAIDMNYASEKASAILQCWYPGAQGGHAVADVLLGKVSPSGKLPLTFYRDLDGMPEFTDYSMKGRTYRYLEKAPLYPFGYGLTYGDVRVTAVSCEMDHNDEGTVGDRCILDEARENGIDICATLENMGNVSTEDVIQVYIKIEGTENEVLNHRLCGFKRVSVAAGEKKDISIHIDKKAFSVINDEGKRVFEGHKALIYVGTGQPDERTQALAGEVTKVITVK